MSLPPSPEVTEKERMYVSLFAEQERRGLTVADLARETGIPSGTISWWKKEIRRREARRGSSGEAAFVPVTVHDAVLPSVGAGFEVLLPNGVRLHVPSAFDEGALQRLVTTLATAC